LRRLIRPMPLLRLRRGSPSYGEVDVADGVDVGGAVDDARVVAAEEGLTAGLRVGAGFGDRSGGRVGVGDVAGATVPVPGEGLDVGVGRTTT
jgi:hypothetical protein